MPGPRTPTPSIFRPEWAKSPPPLQEPGSLLQYSHEPTVCFHSRSHRVSATLQLDPALPHTGHGPMDPDGHPIRRFSDPGRDLSRVPALGEPKPEKFSVLLREEREYLLTEEASTQLPLEVGLPIDALEPFSSQPGPPRPPLGPLRGEALQAAT